MNVNRVYIANIYIVTSQTLVGNSVNFFENQICSYIEYYKTALVYRNDYYCYTDLVTKERYGISSLLGIADAGKFVVRLDDRLTPLNDIVQFKKSNVLKRKILKKYNEFKGDINKCK